MPGINQNAKWQAPIQHQLKAKLVVSRKLANASQYGGLHFRGTLILLTRPMHLAYQRNNELYDCTAGHLDCVRLRTFAL